MIISYFCLLNKIFYDIFKIIMEVNMNIEKIKELLASQLNISIDKIKDDSKLVEDLGADSLDMVEMLMTLEDEFGVSIPDEDALNLKTVSDIAKYISKK